MSKKEINNLSNEERKKLIRKMSKKINDRLEHLNQALLEVELMEKGLLPKKSAREFLKELRNEFEERR